MATDPGWVPALGNFWRYAFFPTWQQRTRRVNEMPVLIWIRTMTLTAPFMWLIIFIVLVLIRRPGGRIRNGTVFAFVVTALGAATLVTLLLARGRSVGGTDPPSVASAYRARFFLGWALASTAVLFGFVFYFQSHALTVFLIGAIFGSLGIIINAPARARIAADQARLQQAGSTVRLLDALMLPNGSIPQRPRR